jgi:hypothetical protein
MSNAYDWVGMTAFASPFLIAPFLINTQRECTERLMCEQPAIEQTDMHNEEPVPWNPVAWVQVRPSYTTVLSAAGLSWGGQGERPRWRSLDTKD